MSRNATVSGGQVGQTLEVKFEFDGTDCVPGDKWRLSAAGLTLAPAAAQEIPVGATSHILTWKSAATLGTGLASPVTVELRKERGAGADLTPVQAFQVAIQPAATAAPARPAAPAAGATPPAAGTPPATMPQPLQVQIVGATPSSAARWVNGAGTMGWLGGLVILLVVLAFLYVVMYVISPTAMNGLSSGVPIVPAGQSAVITEVKQTTVSADPAVLQEAAKASANIQH